VRDLDLLPPRVRDEMEIVPVERMDQVLERALFPGCAKAAKRRAPRTG
jgi:ATP-dependent Lon protease